MKTIKKGLLKLLDLLGFKHSTPYMKEYLHRANMRSGLFMAAIVIILEVWLVIRQHSKYILPQVNEGMNYFESLFNNTSLFWLIMFMGVSLFSYCIFTLSERKTKVHLIAVIIASAIGLTLCALLPLEARIKEFNPKKLVDTILLIILYSSIILYHIATIIATIFKYKGRDYEWLTMVLVITLFAFVLLVFGVKVSYSDFFSSAKFDSGELQHKQIICFLTMVIYVACLLIWKPYISISILGAVFLGFYFLLESNMEVRALPEGDQVNYITFFISLSMISISIYNQRIAESRKDEELEILATQDKLSGLLSFEYFATLCDKKIKSSEIKAGEWIYLFIDISSFKIFNDQRGFEQGNVLLKNVGEILKEEFPNSLITRQSDDHFVVFTKNEDVYEKFSKVNERVRALDSDIRPGVRAGGYPLEDLSLTPHNAVEKARYSFSALKRRGGHDIYLAYDKKMEDKYYQIQYIVSHIDKAVNDGWIVAYYQPVVYSKDRKLCGVEALARWIDPKYGFLSPGTFIEALEDSQLAYKLDLAMLELVCKNMRKVLDKKEVIVPTSINFSRSDFSIIDVPSEIVRITKKYDIPTKYLHIEITESALLEERVDLKDAMNRIKANGFSLWLDDFGSGYSSFNTLKDYNFDVLKLDMEFLKGFESNEKCKPLIKSVIDMANQIGMRTLSEGVETEEQAKFLKEIGCEKLQGYLISKPIPYKELNDGIAEGKFVIAKKLD